MSRGAKQINKRVKKGKDVVKIRMYADVLDVLEKEEARIDRDVDELLEQKEVLKKTRARIFVEAMNE